LAGHHGEYLWCPAFFVGRDGQTNEQLVMKNTIAKNTKDAKANNSFFASFVFFAVVSPKILQLSATNAFRQHLSPKILQPPAAIAFSQRFSANVFHYSLLIANYSLAASPPHC
jgi:hypothetical protein